VSQRVIRKSARYCDLQIADLLQSLCALEVASPGKMLWIVSAWVSDIPVIDNRDASFSDLDPLWGTRWIRLSEVLVAVASRGTEVVVVTNTEATNHGFLHRLHALASDVGVSDRIAISQREDLHAKGLLGDDFHLHGSMNFTHNGVRVLAEDVVLEVDSDHVHRAHLEYLGHYGAVR
jgi:hypothetical protein